MIFLEKVAEKAEFFKLVKKELGDLRKLSPVGASKKLAFYRSEIKKLIDGAILIVALHKLRPGSAEISRAYLERMEKFESELFEFVDTFGIDRW